MIVNEEREARSKERRNQQIRGGKHLIRRTSLSLSLPLPFHHQVLAPRKMKSIFQFSSVDMTWVLTLPPSPPQNLECPIRDGIIDFAREEGRVHTRNDNIFNGEKGRSPPLLYPFSSRRLGRDVLPPCPSFLSLFWLVRGNSSTMQLRNASILPGNISRCSVIGISIWDRSDLTGGTNRGRRNVD